MIKSYHVKHRRDFADQLEKAQLVANFAVANKNNRKLLTSKHVKTIGLQSIISCQILRKYGRGTIKKASNVNLIVPNMAIKHKLKTGNKIYQTIEYDNGIVHIKPLKVSFRWNPGKSFKRINQIEISKDRFMIAATFENKIIDQKYDGVLGIDLNCGIGRSVANCANLRTGEVVNLGRQGPNIRKKYMMKRKKQKVHGDKEKRIMRDLDHKISRTIVNYALKNKLKIVMENLKGIRKQATKGTGSKGKNRVINSWSFYRLQQFVIYKAKECDIPVIKVNPHYTSQECSICSVIGDRDRDSFICRNKECRFVDRKRHADINAAFNVGKRSHQEGGIVAVY